MNSKEYKILLTIQAITLILVSIIFFEFLSKNESSSKEGRLNYITSPKSHNSKNSIKVNGRENYLFGKSSAPNFLIVFSNYSCDHCRYFYKHVMDSLSKKYIETGILKIVAKNTVEEVDSKGMFYAKIAEVARQTGHFLEVHEILVNMDDNVDSLSLIKSVISAGVTEIDLKNKFNTELTLNNIKADNKDAKNLNIFGTPSFVLNGKVNIGYMTYKDIVLKLK
jgi:protein-disulfide isomerase